MDILAAEAGEEDALLAVAVGVAVAAGAAVGAAGAGRPTLPNKGSPRRRAIHVSALVVLPL